MSRGYGRVQRKIAEILARDVDDAYRVDDLCEEIYGNVEKKHRVAIIRAGKALARERPEIGWDSSTLGLSFFHQGSVLSRAKARMKGCMGYLGNSNERISKDLQPGGSWWYKHIIEGGLYWQRTEAWKKVNK
jgi:hypothetical protein